MKNTKWAFSLLLICALLNIELMAQQRPDTLFQFSFINPNYSLENGPTIYIDGTHNNLHQLNGGFAPFAKLAQRDGYKLKAYASNTQLKATDLLVIANPINSKNQGNWKRPIHAAFAEDEIKQIVAWVEAGGRLLLIADHMPFAGAANNLAKAFGFNFCDGFAQLSVQENGQEAFTLDNKRLTESIITNGTLGAKINKVISFTGSSFSMPDNAISVMQFQANDRCLKPEIAWQFDETTDEIDISGNHQGAIMGFGKGKIAVFGEAAMFTAQSITQNNNTFKIGFNTPAASQNVEFVRNVLLWLSSDFD